MTETEGSTSSYNRRTASNSGWIFGDMKSPQPVSKPELKDQVSSYLIEQKKRIEAYKPLGDHRAKWLGWEARVSRIFSELRILENDLQGLVYAESHNESLREIGEEVRKEILNERRRYGRNNNLERRMLAEVLFHIKPTEEGEGSSS